MNVRLALSIDILNLRVFLKAICAVGNPYAI